MHLPPPTRRLPFQWLQLPTPPDHDLVKEAEKLIRTLLPRKIRCPKCAWRPRPESRWWCKPECGHSWNTFDTGGRCPKCSYQWEHTACLRCSQWSRHVDWYEAPREGGQP